VLALVLVDVAVLFGLLDVEGAVVAGMDVEQPGGRGCSALRISGRHDAFQFSPHYYSILPRSIFAEWGLNQANTRRGVFRVKNQ
jgi:hypothetical protein